ncbi:hypothetical protein ACFPOB_27680 [Bosea eneae]|uniref:DUF2158 domain-containing protein n=1 Tax=Bosea eneae TaxID=151454 RepID=A0ABW0IYZ7_9HYPH
MSASGFVSRFQIGDIVRIDGDKDLRATVIGVLFRAGHVEFEVSWLFNGEIRSAWIASFRLERLT